MRFGSATCTRGRCAPTTYGPPADSVTLFEGRPGALRPVETVVLRHRRGCGPPVPYSVGVASAGLVVYEVSPFPCPRGVSRLVLRTFSGRLVRVLAGGLQVVTAFAAAGPWVAFIQHALVVGQQDRLQVVRVTTGRTVLRLSRGPSPPQGIDAVAPDRSGRVALMTAPGNPQPCQQRGEFEQLSVGQIGHPGLQVLTRSAEGQGTATSPGMVIAGDRVAYGHPAGRCLTGTPVAIAAPGAARTPVPDLKFGIPLAFDGRTVATAHGNTVQLTTVPA